MNDKTINQQLKVIDVNHLDEASIGVLRQLCQAEQIAQITHIETLRNLTNTLSKLTSQSTVYNNWLTVQNSEQWQATLVALSQHTLLNNNVTDLQQGSRCLTSILLVLKNVMEQLPFRKAQVWQGNNSLISNLNKLLQVFSGYVDSYYMNIVFSALKYIDAPSWPGFGDSIESSLMTNLISQIDRLDDKYKALCLQNLALWHLDQSTLPDGAVTCLRQLFNAVVTVDKDQFHHEGDNIVFKRALVQSFYALTVHECFEDFTRFNHLIADFEGELKHQTSYISKSEAFCLDAIERRLTGINEQFLGVNKQALIGGYPVDGVIEVDHQKCVVEIDGAHHKQFKQHLIDDYRDRLLSQLGYWVVRIDLDKLPYTGRGEYSETELSFLAHYLKSLHNIECLTYNADPQSFIKKVLAPTVTDELYNIQIDETVTSIHVPETLSAAVSNEDDQYKQMLDAIYQKNMPVNNKIHPGKTALHMAIERCSYENVCALIDQYKADVTIADENNHVPLDLAIMYGNETISNKLKKTLNQILFHELTSSQDRPNKVIKLLKAGASLSPLKLPLPNILFLSIIYNKLATFKKIDAYYPDLKWTTHPLLKNSILHTAINYNHHEIAQYIIDNIPVKIDFKDKNDRTALHYAVISNDYNATLMLIRAGADVTLTFNQTTTVQLAHNRADAEVQELIQQRLDEALLDCINCLEVTQADVDHFIQAGARPEFSDDQLEDIYTPLEMAISSKNISMVKHLVEKHKVSICTRDEDNNTPLHYIFDGDMDNGEVLDFLLSCPDIDVNAQSLLGNTPLHGALILGCYQYAEKLIQDPRTELDRLNSNLDTALHLAFDKQAPVSVIQQMLDRLHDDNQLASHLYMSNKAGKNPLVLALMRGYLDCLKGYGLDFSQPLNICGARPVHVLASYGWLGDLEFLIGQGFDLQATDDEEHNVLHYAIFYEQSSVVAYLLQNYHFSVNDTNSYNETALHLIVEFYNIDIVKILIQHHHQADCTIKNNNNCTPYLLAYHEQGKNDMLTWFYFDQLVFQLNQAIRHSEDHPEVEIEPILKILLHNPDTPIPTDIQQNKVINPIIHNTVDMGLTNTVGYLMRHYSIQMAKPDAEDGTTLLYKAVKTNNLGLTHAFLDSLDTQPQQSLLENKHALVNKAIQNDNPQIMIKLLQQLYTLNQSCCAKVSPSKPRNNKKKRNKNKKKEVIDPALFDFMVFLKTSWENAQEDDTLQCKSTKQCLKMLAESPKSEISQVLARLEQQFCSSNASDKENDVYNTFTSPPSASNPGPVSSNYSVSASPVSFANERKSIKPQALDMEADEMGAASSPEP